MIEKRIVNRNPFVCEECTSARRRTEIAGAWLVGDRIFSGCRVHFSGKTKEAAFEAARHMAAVNVKMLGESQLAKYREEWLTKERLKISGQEPLKIADYIVDDGTEIIASK